MLESRLAVLAEAFPVLLPTVAKLNGQGIVWMIAGSACLYVNGNERMPKDIDCWLSSAGHDAADAAFGITSSAYESRNERIRKSNPGDASLEFLSGVEIRKEGATYRLEPTALVLDRRTVIEHDGESFHVAPVEEVLLIKVLLGRGAADGKHDIEDIREYLKAAPKISLYYIAERQEELGLSPRFFENAVRAAL